MKAARKYVGLLLGALLALLFAASATAAQEPADGAEALERLFTEPIQEEGLAPAFLDAITVPELEALGGQGQAQVGEFVAATPVAGTRLEVPFERALVPTEPSLDAQGRVQGLFFQPPEPLPDEDAGPLAGSAELPGDVSVLVLEGGEELFALDADRPLAVGSAFKLAILTELQELVASGEAAWDDVLHLETEWISLPSGILQEWPAGTALTVETLATLMIAMSDNTATDALLAYTGRENVESHSPHNRPFLSTREAFVLKALPNEELLASYLEADPDQRRRLLDEEVASLPLPAVSDLPAQPRALEVEWYVSASALCSLMAGVEGLELMTINPGPAATSGWERAAFKGGSEPGVLNLTSWVEANGRELCVTATWNDRATALDEARFVGLYSALLRSVRE